jgi:hypothetical protein
MGLPNWISYMRIVRFSRAGDNEFASRAGSRLYNSGR